jgi:hypothetical protein
MKAAQINRAGIAENKRTEVPATNAAASAAAVKDDRFILITTDRDVRGGHHPCRHGAARRQTDYRLGASNHRHRSPLCAISGYLLFPTSPGLKGDGPSRLYRCCNGLSGIGHTWPAPLPCRRQRRPRRMDSVRAAHNLARGEAQKRFAVSGHSQGGQAVLYASVIAKSYALILNYQESRQRRRPRTWEPLCAPISPRREARTYSP